MPSHINLPLFHTASRCPLLQPLQPCGTAVSGARAYLVRFAAARLTAARLFPAAAAASTCRTAVLHAAAGGHLAGAGLIAAALMTAHAACCAPGRWTEKELGRSEQQHWISIQMATRRAVQTTPPERKRTSRSWPWQLPLA
eukprot:366301-Chlamydomonas_euryale.AAC.37